MKTNLLGMSLDAMEKFFVSLGEKPYRARQVFQWIHQKGISNFGEMSNCLLYTSPSPRDLYRSRMPSSA